MGGAKKKIKKIIPKEVKPAVPYIAAFYGGPALGAKLGFKSALAQKAVGKGLSAALASKIQGDDTKTALRSGLFAAAPDVISGGIDKAAAGSNKFADFLNKTKTLKDGTQTVSIADKARAFANPETFGGQAKLIGSQAVLDASARAVELNEKALRDYEAKLAEQGILAKDDRRNQIFGYFSRAGYGDDEINTMLSKYGYADGGRVGFNIGGLNRKPAIESDVLTIPGTVPDADSEEETIFDKIINIFSKDKRDNKKITQYEPPKLDTNEEPVTQKQIVDLLKEATGEDDESKTYKRLGNLQSGLQGILSGYEMATGMPLMGARPQPTRFGLAEGGIPSAMAMRKTVAELIQAGIIDEEDVEKAVQQIKMRAMDSMKAPGFADGGIMNLGGREMDMRGGGFIPIGAKEKADDVPARLSKNEFVMTADAVRGAGNGSINKGAKRMYDLMNKLESKV